MSWEDEIRDDFAGQLYVDEGGDLRVLDNTKFCKWCKYFKHKALGWGICELTGERRYAGDEACEHYKPKEEEE